MSNRRSVELISLIYKCPRFAQFIIDEMMGPFCKVEGWDISARLVANDANESVLSFLAKSGFPYSIFNNDDPSEFYINRCYKALNYAVKTSNAQNVCLLNSDLSFSPKWLENLLKHHDGTKIPVSRLVESGRMTSGRYGISMDFGRDIDSFNKNREAWLAFAAKNPYSDIKEGGLFTPVIFNKEQFIKGGGFIEGNLYLDGPGKINSQFIESGDAYSFRKIAKINNLTHVTVMNSLVYHQQSSEMLS